MFSQILIPYGACESPRAIQCVASFEKRRCLVRREGADSKTEDLIGYYVCGVYCAQELRGNGMATSMMTRLLGGDQTGIPYANIHDPDDVYLPDMSVHL